MTILPLVQGVPLDLSITVEGGAARYPDGHEVRGEIRSTPAGRTLLFALTPYLSSAVVGEDVVVDLHLTGAQTRQISGGALDVFIAEGPEQAQALRIFDARLEVTRAITRWE